MQPSPGPWRRKILPWRKPSRSSARKPRRAADASRQAGRQPASRRPRASRRRGRQRNRTDLARKPKQKREKELPSREAILAFVAENSGRAGKREIARAFGISGGDRIGLKRVLRDLADDGLIEGRRKHIGRPGDLPSVTVLAVEGIDDQGEPVGVPVEWDEEWGASPRIVISAAGKAGRGRDKAPGIGDRVLARLTPDEATGG